MPRAKAPTAIPATAFQETDDEADEGVTEVGSK